MTEAEVAAQLAAARAEAARRCGLGAWPAELIAVSERLLNPGHWHPATWAAMRLRRELLLREVTR